MWASCLFCCATWMLAISAIQQCDSSWHGGGPNRRSYSRRVNKYHYCQRETAATATTNGSGAYQSHALSPGTYIVIVSAAGFASSSSKAVTLAPGRSTQYSVALQIQIEQQKIQVDADALTVDTAPENNVNAIVLKGKKLDALSDDPDEVQDELQALAGPNGGQIYIDGFTGGQIPPKSSIREIRINQNLFSAQFDRLGYGRVEIFTKPGTDRLQGQSESRGNESILNSQNPILNANLKPGEAAIQQPSYYSYNVNGSVGGPINKGSSYSLSVFARNNQNEAMVDATNPKNTAETLNEAISNPSTRIDVSPRIDLQLGKANTLTIRDDFYRAVQSNSGLSVLTLPTQAYNTSSVENAIQVSDSLVLSKNSSTISTSRIGVFATSNCLSQTCRPFRCRAPL
jgi:Carboxypeptidase regulatory-like domain